MPVYYGGFKPNQIKDSILWLDGADSTSVILRDGQYVSQWDDKSGNGNHVIQASQIKQPSWNIEQLNSLPILTFTGSQDLLKAITPQNTNDCILYFVLRDNDPSPNRGMFSSNTPTWQQFISTKFFGGNSLIPYLSDGSWHILTCLFRIGGGVNSEIFIDDVSIASGNANTFGTDGFRVGSYLSLLYFIGNIAEIIRYDRLITQSESNQIINYLNIKWSL